MGAVLLAIGSVVLLTWLSASPATAVPARPGAFELEQPDGTTFRAHLFGDEWYNGVETGRGHTILQGPRGWWRYAERAADGSLVRSDLRVGVDAPTAARHLRDPVRAGRSSRVLGMAPNQDDVSVDPGIGGPSRSPSLGTERSLVILAQFLDQSSLGTTAAQWSSAYFGAGKSVQDYYGDASAGAFTLAPAAESFGTVNDGVVGWVTLSMNHPNRLQSDAVNRAATRAAIIAADPYVNYAAYDTNGDGVVRNHELHVTVIAAGQEASCCSAWGKAVWGHRWWLQSSEIPTVDGKSVGGWGYTQFGEMHGNHMATLGIMAHEIGHDLELPDLYDADRPGPSTSDGVGIWSVMGGGSWLGLASDTYGSNGGQTPPLFDAWSRWNLGWITPHQVAGTETRTISAAASGGGSNVAVQLLDNPGGVDDWGFYDGAGSGEYFLVENRQRIAGTYDESLPGNGLLVLHVDENRDDNTTDADRLVDVEEADGLAELDVPGGDAGDAGDLYPGTSGNRSFGPGTSPNSNLADGSASDVTVSGVSDSATTMSAIFSTVGGGGGGTPPPNDMFASASSVSTRVFDDAVSTTAASVEDGELAQTGCPLGRTVWYRYTPGRDVRLRVDTIGSSFDTVLNLWRGTTIGGLTQVQCNDDIETGTTATSRLTEFVAQAGQTYYLQVGGYYDSAAGTVAAGSLQLHARVRPLNDDFAQATTISGHEGSVSGNNANASKETGEPAHAGNSGGSSVWWTWTAPSTGLATIDTLGSAADDTLLGVYSGGSLTTLTEVAASDDIETNNTLSRVTFQAQAGTTYRIAVDGYGNTGANRGELALNWALGTGSEPKDVTVGLSAVDLPGTEFGYRATVDRSGPSDTSPVTVDLTLPPTVSVGSVPPACDVDGTTVHCDVGPVASGATEQLTVGAVPLSPGPHTAQLALMSTDEVPDGNAASGVAGVEAVCDNTPTTGDDVIVGSPGDDVLCGLHGDDDITGDGGDDLVFGGPGFDVLAYRTSPGPVVVNLNFQSLDSETAWPGDDGPADGNDRATGMEAAVGSAWPDWILGRTSAADVLRGSGGADRVYGYGGADLLYGSAGADQIWGGAGRDRLVGGSGIDRLDGGPRRDSCRDARDRKRSCEG